MASSSAAQSGAAAVSAPVSASRNTGASTGTAVDGKVQQLSGDLDKLRGRLNDRATAFQKIRQTNVAIAARYHALTAAIQARLQVGSTPGNPQLTDKWNQAQVELESLSRAVSDMSSLGNDIAADASIAAFLLDSARATYGISGALEQDHANLAALEDNINRAQVQVKRLLNSVTVSIARQTAYAGNERRNLGALALAIKNGELYGVSLSSPVYRQVSAPTDAGAPPSGAPLVVIRFDRPDVDYKQALYTAVSRVIQQRPNTRIELIAVSPGAGAPADVALARVDSRQKADQVLQTLIGMGLSVGRIGVTSNTSTDVSFVEIRVFAR